MEHTKSCIFCKIIAGTLAAKKVYENEHVLAFADITPQAPVHILVIPKRHIDSAAEVTEENSVFIAKCFEAIAIIAKQEGLDTGFRVITNTGRDGAQSVFHIHFHLLGGQMLPHDLV